VKQLKDKKCKFCERKFTPIRPLQQICSYECSMLYAKKLNEKKEKKEWQKRKAKLKSELLTLQDYIKVAQSYFNAYINLRDKGKDCISCFKPIKGRVNASHYYNSNNHWNVRFNEDNVHSSCITCNQYLSGNLIEYRKGLINRIGLERLEQLESIANETRKFTIDEVKQIAETYKQKVKTLKNS
jgi:predicted nucleic acid-binding protein